MALSDAELVRRTLAGDDRAFRVLYDTHVDRIFRLTYRMSGDEDLAREFTQETFVKAYHKLSQFRGDAALSTWLHTVAVTITLNGLRRVKGRQGRERPLDAGVQVADRTPASQPFLRSRLKDAIDRLPELYRTVFLMHDLEGYTHVEIAATLDVAVGTSKARLSRAREKLRGMLGDLAEEFA